MKKRYYCTHKEYTTYRHPYLTYRFFYHTFKIFIPKFKIKYEQQLEGQNIYVSNHSKAFGVLFACKYLKKDTRIWADGALCFYKTAPKYMLNLIFGGKKRYYPLAFIIGYLLVGIMRGAKVIPVYRDARLITTYKKTIETLKEGKNVLLFAENPTRYNKYLNELNKGFVEVGRMVNKYMKKDINFVPMYIAWTIRETSIGTPITFDPSNNYRLEVERVSTYIRDEITRLAEELPEHKVINFN